MKGYSKIKLMNSSNTTKSRSMDFSDETITTPTIQKPISIKKSSTIVTTQQQQPKKPDDDDDDDDDDYKQYSTGNHHQEEDNNFPTKMLTRNRSVASRNDGKNTNSRLKIEKQNSTGATLVKRVLSIGRSSSVSERYSRIHDQYANSFYDDGHHDEKEEEEDELQMGRSENKMKKQRSHNRGGVLKACKRFFGF